MKINKINVAQRHKCSDMYTETYKHKSITIQTMIMHLFYTDSNEREKTNSVFKQKLNKYFSLRSMNWIKINVHEKFHSLTTT